MTRSSSKKKSNRERSTATSAFPSFISIVGHKITIPASAVHIGHAHDQALMVGLACNSFSHGLNPMKVSGVHIPDSKNPQNPISVSWQPRHGILARALKKVMPSIVLTSYNSFVLFDDSTALALRSSELVVLGTIIITHDNFI